MRRTVGPDPTRARRRPSHMSSARSLPMGRSTSPGKSRAGRHRRCAFGWMRQLAGLARSCSGCSSPEPTMRLRHVTGVPGFIGNGPRKRTRAAPWPTRGSRQASPTLPGHGPERGGGNSGGGPPRSGRCHPATPAGAQCGFGTAGPRCHSCTDRVIHSWEGYRNRMGGGQPPCDLRGQDGVGQTAFRHRRLARTRCPLGRHAVRTAVTALVSRMNRTTVSASDMTGRYLSPRPVST